VKWGENFGLSTTAPIRSMTAGSRSGTGSPKSRIVPAVACASPSSIRIVVVLPDPFGPRKPCTPPAGTARSRSRTATRRPRRERNSLRSPLVSMTWLPGASVTGQTLGGQQLDPWVLRRIGSRVVVGRRVVGLPRQEGAQVALDVRRHLGDGDVATELAAQRGDARVGDAARDEPVVPPEVDVAVDRDS
jgi:hypothetical protein